MKGFWMKRKRRQICLTESQCQDILMLLHSGFSFQESMELLEEEGKEPVFEAIRKRLMQGEEAEEFMGYCLPRDLSFYFTCFSSFLPFEASLQVTMDIIQRRRKAADEMRKSLFYPLTLLSGAICGVFLFDRTILPKMVSLMNAFAGDISHALRLSKLFEVCSAVLIVLCLFTAVCAAYFLSGSRITATYRFLSQHMPDCLLVQYASVEFARIFCACVSVNLSTRSCLALMKKLKDKPLAAYIAGELEKSFEKGRDMNEAVRSPCLEKKLARFFHLAIYASDTETMLKGYMEMSQKRTERRIRKLTYGIQIAAYGWIGFMLVIVYQVLMMPLGMMRQIG